MKPCCTENVLSACADLERENERLRVEVDRPADAHGEEALLLLKELLKERKGDEFEWMPNQARWRRIRALLVEAGRL
jgi:hypothetical protein